jgi:hypothetical protein
MGYLKVFSLRFAGLKVTITRPQLTATTAMGIRVVSANSSRLLLGIWVSTVRLPSYTMLNLTFDLLHVSLNINLSVPRRGAKP